MVGWIGGGGGFTGGGGSGLGFGTIASAPYTSYIQSGNVANFGTATYGLSLNPIGGNVGIGVTSMYGQLQVAAATAGTTNPDVIVGSGSSASGNNTQIYMYRSAATGGYGGIDAYDSGVSGTVLALNGQNHGSVAIGKTTAATALDVNGTVTASALAISGLETMSGGNPFSFNSIGSGTYNKTIVTHDGTNGLYFDLARTSDSSGASVIPFNIYSRGGIPILNLSVSSPSTATGDVTMQLGQSGSNNTTLNVGTGGTGSKVNTGTVDPPYTIDGIKYATYMSSMTGVKEETTGVVSLKGGKYVLDLTGASQGSDLWLFSKVTNLASEGLSNVTVLLSPSFDGKTWYEKKDGKIVIYGDSDGEVSYRLTAPRFDHDDSQFLNTGATTYGNLRPASDKIEGFNLDKLLK